MRIGSLLWNQSNLDHIAEHNVEWYEVEEAIWNKAWFENRRGKQRYHAYGQTDSGRYLFIVLDRRAGSDFYVVTARDMNDREKRYYRRIRK